MSQNLLQLKNGSKSYVKRKLFDQATFSINVDEHVGVIGPNGAGKSTLFNILIENDLLDDGEIIKSTNLRLGYLQQEVLWNDGVTLEDYLTACPKPIWELKSLARQLDLKSEHFTQTLNTMSGGYRMRCKLLYLLGFEPNLMLLDEPTNYLDLETVLVLENFLQNYKGAFLLISHDREFLRRTTDHTLEIEGGEITKFNGNIDDYFEQKQMLREQLAKTAQSLADKRKTIEDFVNRFGAKASKARQAQSRLKLLDKMEKIEVKALPITAHLRIPEPERTSKLAIKIKDAEIGYPQRKVLTKVNCEIESGDRVAIVGFNGVGKSTFLKTIAQKIDLLSGTLNFGLRVSIGYFGQHVAEELHPHNTVFAELAADAPNDIIKQQILDIAGALLFSGDDAHKTIGKLSGGEKSRVALGKIFLKKPSVLVLDEPTNHLDFFTVEALTQALIAYRGTILLVSHDRGFVSRVANKIFEIRDGKLTTYLGSYDDYVWKIEKETFFTNTEQKPTPTSISTTRTSSDQVEFINQKPSFFELKQKQKDLEKTVRQCDTNLAKTEVKMTELEEKIDSLARSLEMDPSQVKAISEELRNAQKTYEGLELLWIELSEKRELAFNELSRLK